MDYCPDVPGTLAYAGCPNPDQDNDGVCDAWVGEAGLHEKFTTCQATDECPDVPGKLEFFGCPEPDSDGDGICNKWVADKGMMGRFPCDGADECPFEFGDREHNGCPPPRKFVVVTEDRIELKEQFFFATNKTKVLPKSEPLLDEIADVLIKNPTIHIRIEGHTDSSGKYKNNIKLSKGRAKSVMDELAKRGIAKERMESEGYGPDRPIDTNDTPEGKANNRRVELHITKR